ncbi:MAG: recombinase family protein, partial [Lawsonibacter sp.]|nr:recombinase family protein [Lawsonibacter sp.]
CYHICRNHDVNSRACPISGVPESEIHSAFCRLYYKLKYHSDQILAPLIADLQTARTRRFLWSSDIVELNKQISNLTSQNQLLAMLKQQGSVDPDIFISRSNELAEQLRTVKQEKSRLLNAEGDDTIARTQELIEILETGPDFLDKFDGELFGELVEKIIVESNERLRFRLKNGLELPEKMERTVR